VTEEERERDEGGGEDETEKTNCGSFFKGKFTDSCCHKF